VIGGKRESDRNPLSIPAQCRSKPDRRRIGALTARRKRRSLQRRISADRAASLRDARAERDRHDVRCQHAKPIEEIPWDGVETVVALDAVIPWPTNARELSPHPLRARGSARSPRPPPDPETPPRPASSGMSTFESVRHLKRRFSAHAFSRSKLTRSKPRACVAKLATEIFR